MFIRTAILALLCISSAAAADVTGTWNVTATTASGREHKMQMVLKQEDGKLSGVMSTEQGPLAIEEAKFAGNELTFRLPVAGGVAVKVTLEGTTMDGVYTTPGGETGKVTASRAAAVAASAVAGHWNCDAKAGSRDYKLQLDLEEQGGKLSGTITRADGTAPIEEAKLEGNLLSFKISADGTVYTAKLTVEGHTMKGTFTTANGDSGSVTGSR